MIERVPFGRTGHHSSRVIFGAAALGSMRQERADELLELLLAHGVNHLDTAASYGESELRLAPWLARHRAQFFLATKTAQRTAEGAKVELEKSLRRLGVDSVDLIQFHNLVEADEWATVHGPGGALEAMVAARQQGLVRFIGVTGHGTRIAGMHRRSLDAFDYDSVLFPYNYAMMTNAAYAADVEALIETCVERQVALQTIKSVARRRWPSDSTATKRSWYEPLPDGPAIARAVDFVLGRPELFLNSSSDARLLGSILAAGQHRGPVPPLAAMEADREAYDVSPLFDGGELERI